MFFFSERSIVIVFAMGFVFFVARGFVFGFFAMFFVLFCFDDFLS